MDNEDLQEIVDNFVGGSICLTESDCLSNLSDKDKKDIWESAKELSTQFGNIADAQQEIKDCANNIKEVFGVAPAVFKKVAKFYYESNVEEEKMKALDVFNAYEELKNIENN